MASVSDQRFRSPAVGLEARWGPWKSFQHFRRWPHILPLRQVKLLEALSRGRRAGEEDDGRPSPLKAAVCLEVRSTTFLIIRWCQDTRVTYPVPQLLGEMEELLGPFSGILGILRKELANCIYSNYYVSADGSASFDQVPSYLLPCPSTFLRGEHVKLTGLHQVPFFSAVARLEEEHEALLLERQRFLRELKRREEEVGRIEAKTGAMDAQAHARPSSSLLSRPHSSHISCPTAPLCAAAGG